IEDVYPCTPLQEGLMAITTQQPGAYIGRWVFRIHKTVEIVAFKEAWNLLIRNTPILRTRIVAGEQDGSIQVVVRQPIARVQGHCLQQYLDKGLATLISIWRETYTPSYY
ncbi:hypothetical protein P175DRAFT_0434262, partial [Aspergillus ochraceoroseus IBT 24754]